jgi:hypothetical protein
MVHGLETMKRLNEEAIDKHQEQEPSESGFSVAMAIILVCVIIIAAIGVAQTASRMSMQSRDAVAWPSQVDAVSVVPLYTFGEEVRLIGGFYDGAVGRVVGWDERQCLYQVKVDSVQGIANVSEDQMRPLRSRDPWEGFDRDV